MGWGAHWFWQEKRRPRRYWGHSSHQRAAATEHSQLGSSRSRANPRHRSRHPHILRQDCTPRLHDRGLYLHISVCWLLSCWKWRFVVTGSCLWGLFEVDWHQASGLSQRKLHEWWTNRSRIVLSSSASTLIPRIFSIGIQDPYRRSLREIHTFHR